MDNILQGYYGKWYRGDLEPDMPNEQECREMIVSVRRGPNHPNYEFTAFYLKEMFLYQHADAEEGEKCTGWYFRDGPEDENYFTPLLRDGDELLAWSYIPTFETARAQEGE